METLLFIAIGGSIALICGLEFLMWKLFFSKTIRICFLTEPDLPLSRFYTIELMKVFAIFHTIFLIIPVVTALLLLW